MGSNVGFTYKYGGNGWPVHGAWDVRGQPPRLQEGISRPARACL